MASTNAKEADISPDAPVFPVSELLEDYRTCCISREVSILARRDVLTGRGKFGITGDGKEVAQVALARSFRKGDWRSGYYRDQTILFALGLLSVEDYFAQLYADPENDPMSGGRQMNAHFATPLIHEDGQWLNQLEQYNISADISPTAGQMARGLGLALASKKYREIKALKNSIFSDGGNEVCFCTIGDASTSEGIFWETVNAACVMQVPLAISVWDDGYGISVPIDYQTTKKSISKALAGMKYDKSGGLRIYTAKGWDYAALRQMYERGIKRMRKEHVPALFHITEVTQPQGHSTSGSHERYKSKERLQWEQEADGIRRMRAWMLAEDLASAEALDAIEAEAKKLVREGRNKAWNNYLRPAREGHKNLKAIYERLMPYMSTQAKSAADKEKIESLFSAFRQMKEPLYYELVSHARRLAFLARPYPNPALDELHAWLEQALEKSKRDYHAHFYGDLPASALNVPAIAPQYSDDSPVVNGFQVLNAFFDKVLERDPRFIAFGEDLGHIGDVNQGFAGLQAKYGEERVFDTGIREWTIVGQAIGMAMRGLRPLAEIQYLDYLVYALEPLTDDLATLRYRSNGIQKAPAIIRTRGHRLEGIWHTGSPMGMLLNALRGMYVLVPRDMTRAAGMYNTLLQSDEPGLVIECLNGYRLKEKLPDNIGTFTVPLGIPEILQQGTDLTLVTYGSCVRVAQEGIKLLEQDGISVELIDVQTLLPFDLPGLIVDSLKKTNRIIFMDEDVPGGATAFMMRQVLEVQGGYRYLDSPPRTLTASEHRSPYGSDGDYFSKPNAEDVYQAVFELMYEAEPGRFGPPGLALPFDKKS